LTAAASLAAFAQTPQTIKIALIDTSAFDNEKGGIVKYTNGMNSLEAGLKKEFDDLQALGVRIQNLEKELTAMQKQLTETNPAVPVNKTQLQTTYTTKAEEYEKSGREYKFKQEDLKVRYQRRRQEVIGPISADIGKALQEFAKQKGYTVILDAGKLNEIGALLAIGDDKIDATKDFITFYNARPATAAVTTPIK
jgi:Skp family chaperone for outer membrane proteins